eukprot:scaffold83149_cov57-Attheya_sp.AAC.3
MENYFFGGSGLLLPWQILPLHTASSGGGKLCGRNKNGPIQNYKRHDFIFLRPSIRNVTGIA